MTDCACARCGGTLFARNPDGTQEPHPAHAHHERWSIATFSRCLHLACFLEVWDEQHKETA